MCSVVIIGDLLDVLEVEAGFEVVHSELGCRAFVSVGNVVEPVTEDPQKATTSADYWLAI